MGYCERGQITIERAANGYTVCMRDPAIEKKNAQRSLKKSTSDVMEPYIDPQKEYVFTDLKTALAFLEKNADKAMPEENYESAFDTMASED